MARGRMACTSRWMTVSSVTARSRSGRLTVAPVVNVPHDPALD